MVTPRTGGLRGRPRKPRSLSRPKGRPRVPFLRDPDRYRVALLDAMLAVKMGSLRACSTAVVVLDIGNKRSTQPARITHYYELAREAYAWRRECRHY